MVAFWCYVFVGVAFLALLAVATDVTVIVTGEVNRRESLGLKVLVVAVTVVLLVLVWPVFVFAAVRNHK